MRKSINCNGVPIFYTLTGHGAPVLLLHGFGESSSIWNKLSDELNDYLLLIPDLPGSGSTEKWQHQHASMSDYASCILSILEHEKIDAVHFIGHSMGGYTAMEFANLYAHKLRSLGLFHSSAYADDTEKIETRRKAIDFIKKNGAESFLKTSTPALFKDAELQHDVIEKLIQEGRSFSRETLVQYYEAMIERKDHSALLSTLDLPILFIMGEHDKAVPLNISLKQCYLPAVSFVHILRESAHMGMYEEPDRCRLIVSDFLREVERD